MRVWTGVKVEVMAETNPWTCAMTELGVMELIRALTRPAAAPRIELGLRVLEIPLGRVPAMVVWGVRVVWTAKPGCVATGRRSV